MASLDLTSEALEQFAELPKAARRRIVRLTERLRDWPDVSGAKPLSGGLAGSYRLRSGDYRLQFRVQGDVIIVEKIGHRDRFYDD